MWVSQGDDLPPEALPPSAVPTPVPADGDGSAVDASSPAIVSGDPGKNLGAGKGAGGILARVVIGTLLFGLGLSVVWVVWGWCLAAYSRRRAAVSPRRKAHISMKQLPLAFTTVPTRGRGVQGGVQNERVGLTGPHADLDEDDWQ